MDKYQVVVVSLLSRTNHGKSDYRNILATLIITDGGSQGGKILISGRQNRIKGRMWVREGLLEKWMSHLMLDYKEDLGRRREDWNDFPSENSTCDYCHVESKFGALNDSMARLADDLSLILTLLGPP